MALSNASMQSSYSLTNKFGDYRVLYFFQIEMQSFQNFYIFLYYHFKTYINSILKLSF